MVSSVRDDPAVPDRIVLRLADVAGNTLDCEGGGMQPFADTSAADFGAGLLSEGLVVVDEAGGELRRAATLPGRTGARSRPAATRSRARPGATCRTAPP